MFEERDSEMSFGEKSDAESDDAALDTSPPRVTLIDCNLDKKGADSKANSYGVKDSVNISKPLLAKLEFGMMMRDQTSPVKKADPHN